VTRVHDAPKILRSKIIVATQLSLNVRFFIAFLLHRLSAHFRRLGLLATAPLRSQSENNRRIINSSEKIDTGSYFESPRLKMITLDFSGPTSYLHPLPVASSAQSHTSCFSLEDSHVWFKSMACERRPNLKTFALRASRRRPCSVAGSGSNSSYVSSFFF
jgi:hypothetical protein